MKSRKKYHDKIMKYWTDCAGQNWISDLKINNLMEEFFIENKISYFCYDLNMSIYNLTNSQMRKLYKKLIESRIIDRYKQ